MIIDSLGFKSQMYALTITIVQSASPGSFIVFTHYLTLSYYGRATFMITRCHQ